MADFPQTRLFAEHTSAAVRGPAGLQQDIADEIADHLACHAESHAEADPAAAQTAAIRAFGDPQQVARELRHIHLGDQIVFQRIMIAVLAVVVLAMSLTAHLSWSANRETARQFAEMNKNLASLVEAQRAATLPKSEPALVPALPPAEKQARIKVFCCTFPDRKPIAGQAITISAEPPSGSQVPSSVYFPRQLHTGPDGWVTTEPLPLGLYTISTRPIQPEEQQSFTPIQVSGSVWLSKHGEDAELHLVLDSRMTQEIRIDVPPELSWDREVEAPAWITFETDPDPSSSSPPNVSGARVRYTYPVRFGAWTRVKGLIPGPAKVYLGLPGLAYYSSASTLRQPGGYRPTVAGTRIGEINVPSESGRIVIPFALPQEDRIVGTIHTGSRERPLANTRVEFLLLAKEGPDQNSCFVQREVVRTNDEGQFVTFARRGYAQRLAGVDLFELSPDTPRFWPVRQVRGPGWTIAIPWHTTDGIPAILHWPLADPVCDPIRVFRVASGETRYECDLSLLGTLRCTFTGLDSLALSDREAVGAAKIIWRTPKESGRSLEGAQQVTLPSQSECDVLLFSGKYSVDVRLPLIEREADVPDLERHSVSARKNAFPVEIKPGQRFDLMIPVDDLSKWKRESTGWYQRAGSPPATAPATQPARP